MMTIPVEISLSTIAGQGVFALRPIKAGWVIWQFNPSLDQKTASALLKYAEEPVREFVMNRGYLNERDEWVVCVDEAQFMNFPNPGESANTKLGGKQDGEFMLVTARDIEPGEEITVPPESDKDYTRKMEARGRK
jgi:SET domain-containing protein